MQTLRQGLTRQIQRFGPLRKGFALAIELNKNIVAGIIALLFLSRPHAIAGFVSLVIIFTLNGMFRGWRQAHINNEILDVFPSIANMNAPVAVKGIVFVVRIFTSLHHMIPNNIKRVLRHAMSGERGFCQRRTCFNVETSAGLDLPSLKRIASCGLFFSAVAFTQKIGSAVLCILGLRAQNTKTAKPTPGQVNGFFMAVNKPHGLSLNMAISGRAF